jgi:hypothetical protein
MKFRTTERRWSVRAFLDYKSLTSTPQIFTTLAFWLRSSVVSVLNSLTTIMRAPPSFFGYQIFAALDSCELCLQLQGRDDLATAVPARVVGGSFSSFGFVSSLLGFCTITIW